MKIRKTFFIAGLPIAAMGVTSLLCSNQISPVKEEQIRPNLIFVIADQWRRMALSHYNESSFDDTYNQGDPVYTPNFDSCIKEGMIFNNAVATAPICSPNRATLITGLYPATHGLVDNSHYERFSYSNETIAQVLTKNGYETGFIGKWHMAMVKPEIFFETPGARRGFNYFYGSPVHNHSHFDARLFHDKNEIDGRGEYTKGGKLLPNPFTPSADYKDKEICEEESWNPNHLTRKALDYLKNTFGVRDSYKPFALYVSYNPPHTIHGPKPVDGNEGSWHIAGRKANESYYAYTDTRQEDYDYRAPQKFEARYRQGPNHSDPVRTDLRSRPNVPKDHYSRTKCLPGYYGAVNSIDDCFGKLDDYLRTTPDPRYPDKMLEETTIVIVTADHGEMMGSQGMMTKGVPYEESIGIPFIVRWPNHVPEGSEENMVFCSVDVAPSILGLLNMKFSKPVDGIDRSSIFLAKKEKVSKYAFVGLRNWRTVRTNDEIYIVESFENMGNQITYYNIKKDPFQMHPIRIDSEFIRNKDNNDIITHLKTLHEALRKHLNELNDTVVQIDKFNIT